MSLWFGFGGAGACLCSLGGGRLGGLAVSPNLPLVDLGLGGLFGASLLGLENRATLSDRLGARLGLCDLAWLFLCQVLLGGFVVGS